MRERMDWVVAGLLALLAPLFLFPVPKGTGALLLVPLLLVARGFVKGRALERTPFDGPILVLLFQIVLTFFVVPGFETGRAKISGVLFGLLVFYALTALFRNPGILKAGLLAYAAGGVVFALAGFLGMLTFSYKSLRPLMLLKEKLPHVSFGLPGAEAGFHPNAVGGTLLLFLPLYLALFLSASLRRPGAGAPPIGGPRTALPFAAAALLGVFVLALTQSRGSWLAFIAGAGVTVLPLIPAGGRRRIFGLFYIPATAAALLVAYVILVGPRKLMSSALELAASLVGRTKLWAFGLRLVGEHPWTGIGLNQVRYRLEVGYDTAHLHNHYLQTAAELGLPALCALLAILIGAGVLCARIWKAAPFGWAGWAALGLGGGLAAQALFGLTDSISLGTKPSFLFWILLALVNGLFEATRRRERSAA